MTGLPAHAAPTNSFLPRREAVAGALGRLIEGAPGLQISPACKVLRKGFAGGYHYRRLKVAGDERYHDEPNKNGFSHVHDALQYALSGGGETLRPRSIQGPITADTAVQGPAVTRPARPLDGRPAEVERTPTGEVIVRNRHGAFYQPHGERHWLPYETAGRARGEAVPQTGAGARPGWR